jgi:SNF2 family DNA or RNA helicase
VIPSRVTVEAGEIRVQPSFAAMVLVKRLGGRFRGARWWWPATPANARLLRSKLGEVEATPEFDALAGPVAAAVEKHFDSTPAATVVANAELLRQSDTLPGISSVGTAADRYGSGGYQQSLTLPLAVVAKVTTFAEPSIAIPEGLRTRPWRHQHAAFEFCMKKFAAGLHGILLAMIMGTGKSLVACMLVLAVNAKRVLIICPLRVVPVWAAQFERHVNAPLVIVTLDEEAGTVAQKQAYAVERMNLAQARGVPFICVINYDSVWREPFCDWAEKVLWDLIVPDEIHRAKQPSGKASMELKRLRGHARYRVGLSGTPMPHGPMDIFAQFRFLDVRILGPAFSVFRQKYALMGGFQRKQITGFQNLEELEAHMSKITFRVGKEVLDLPAETSETYYCELTGEAARIYRELDEDFVTLVKDGTITAANAMVKLLRLQQVTGGCVPTDDAVPRRVDSAKLKLLADTLEDIGPEEPVVVFGRFHADLDAVHEACASVAKENGYETGGKSLELSGRRDEIARWQVGEAQVLAVQIDSGGEGVDLTRARYSIFYSTGFKLGKYEQAKARTHRPGQLKPVMHIHLIARGTVDVKIMRALEKRAEVVEAILAEIKN